MNDELIERAKNPALAIEPIVDGRFEITGKLGEGGMGVVYEASHREMQRLVALKVLKSDGSISPEQQMRFKQEAQVISKLNHPNIVSVYSVGLTQSGSQYIAMELLPGKSLADWVNERGPLSWRLALPLFVQACSAFEHAHNQGIIHRDIKPSNLIVIGELTAAATVKVVDFGIAKVLGSDSITHTNVIVGSAFYMSPGQCEGRSPDVQSDIYALGCSLFEVLAGRPPFVADFYLETMVKHRSETPPRVKDVHAEADLPDGLEDVIACCLRKDGQSRYANIAALREDLEHVLGGTAPTNIPVRENSGRISQETYAKHVGARQFPWRPMAIALTAVVAALCICALMYVGEKTPSDNSVSSDVARSQSIAALDQQLMEVSTLLHVGKPESFQSAARILLSTLKESRQLGAVGYEGEAMESASWDWRHLIDIDLRAGNSASVVREVPLNRELELSALTSLERAKERRSETSLSKRQRENCVNTATNLAMGLYQLNYTEQATPLVERALEELGFMDMIRDKEACQEYQHVMQNLISPALAHNQPELAMRLLKERLKWMERARWARTDVTDVLRQYSEQARTLGHRQTAADIHAMIDEIKSRKTVK